MQCFGVVLILLAAAGGPGFSDRGADAGWEPVDAGAPDAAGMPADAGTDDDEDEAPAGDDEEILEEGEAREAAGNAPADGGLWYSTDISDEELARLWQRDLAALGTISVGFVDEGRLINAEQLPAGEGWTIVTPEYAWGTREAMQYVQAAITAVRDEFPGTPPLRVNHISKREGGYLRPHQSHQAGRDVDLAFYYRREPPPGYRGRREDMLDVPRNWALVRAVATRTDAYVIIVDKRIQKVLYEYAVSIGEDREWLDSLFHAGAASLVKHARHHRDHFHLRFYAPRSQELGRRVQPLLAQRPDQNIAMHRVRNGDTLGHIARRYGSTVKAIMMANHMRRTFLRLGQRLFIPLRGPCIRCPVAPPVVIPPRRLPRHAAVRAIADGGPATDAAVDDAGLPDAWTSAAQDGGDAGCTVPGEPDAGGGVPFAGAHPDGGLMLVTSPAAR